MPLTQKIESAFSRVANGNFSNYLAFWEGSLEYRGDPSVGIGEPHCECKATGEFKHVLQYRDLAVYPSSLYFSGGKMVPLTMYDVLVSNLVGVDPQFKAFDYAATVTGRKAVPAGSWAMIDTGHASTSGEYRIGTVYDANTSSLRVTTAAQAKVAGSPLVAEYQRVQPTSSISGIRITTNLSNLPRLDGTTGVRTGDYFVAEQPSMCGRIWSISGTTYYIAPDHAWHRVPPVTTQFRPVKEWMIVEPQTVAMTRVAPAALYDLTLVYTVRTGYGIDPAQIRIRCFDELDALIGEIGPVSIDGSNKYFSRPIGSNRIRVVQRFMLEREEPYFGRFEIQFVQAPAAVTWISDVALYRGNFTDRFLENDSTSVESYDLLEVPVAVESEIIPKGTIIAYVGGSACPPGFIPAEGLGKEEHELTPFDVLVGDWRQLNEMYMSHEIIYPVYDDEPRTMIRLDEHGSRDTRQPPYPFQVAGKFFPVTAWTSDDPNVAVIRAEVGNPTPVWVIENYVRTDITPGYVLEFIIPEGGSTYRHVYAVITQFSEGEFVTRVREEPPQYPFFRDGDARRRAERQVRNGAPRNSVYRGYAFYGEFITEYERRIYMELLGDWRLVVARAVETHAPLRVWKSGVLAHAQGVPEFNGGYPASGGYSRFGDVHSHLMPQGTAGSVPDVGQSGDGTIEIPLPTRHSHGHLFGAVTLPKVRPVLLCQKV